MAAVHGKDVKILVWDSTGSSRDISPDMNSITLTHTRDNPTITTFSQTTESRIAGIRDGQLSGAGIYNSSCANLAAASILDELMAGSLITTVQIAPAGSVAGRPKYTACMLLSQFEVQGTNTAPVGISFTFQMASGSISASTI